YRKPGRAHADTRPVSSAVRLGRAARGAAATRAADHGGRRGRHARPRTPQGVQAGRNAASGGPRTWYRDPRQAGGYSRGLRRRLAEMPAFVNFAVGGALIALLGALLLEGLVRVGTGPLVAQAVQLAVTLALNFAYNYKITWRRRAGTGLARQVAWFLATRGATQGASWFAFAGLTALGLQYQLANGACLAGAMVINFVTSDKLVFRDGRTSRRKLPAGPHVRSRVRALAAGCVLAGVAGAWYLLRLPVLPTVMLAVAGFNLLVSGLEVRWRLYGWRTPDAAAQM